MSNDTGSVLTLFTTDKGIESKGKWIDVGPASFLLARAGGANQKYQNKLAATLRPHQRRIQMGQMDEGEANDLLLDTFVDAVLLNWKNVRLAPTKNEAGETVPGAEIPYSKETAKHILSQYPDLFAFLREESTRISNYAPDQVEAIAGN
jgi:hypothetical protein